MMECICLNCIMKAKHVIRVHYSSVYVKFVVCLVSVYAAILYAPLLCVCVCVLYHSLCIVVYGVQRLNWIHDYVFQMSHI